MISSHEKAERNLKYKLLSEAANLKRLQTYDSNSKTLWTRQNYETVKGSVVART